jgi:hypothetical protein
MSFETLTVAELRSCPGGDHGLVLRKGPATWADPFPVAWYVNGG